MRHGLSFFLLVFSTGCFSSGPPGTPDASDDAPAAQPDASADVVEDVVATGDATWTDGTALTTSVLIQGGSTVTIAPGAHVTAASGVVIWIMGTLKVASSAGPHAVISGAGWTGLRTTDYGILDADGLDLDGATTALDIQQQAGATYANGTISNSATPIGIGVAGNLSVTHAYVTSPHGISRVAGALTASYLDYDASDHGAFFVDDKTARFFAEDSTFHNSGPLGSKSAPDLLTVNAAMKLHVAYSDLSGAHCGLHFEGVDTVEIDHVTVHDVTNGADVWGSSNTGTRTITSSNFEKLSENFDETNANGPFSVSGCYMTGTNKLAASSAITIASPAPQEIADAKPR